MSSFCLGCGKSLAEGERFCASCGKDSQAGSTAPRVDPGIAFGLSPENSGKAIFSLVSGILFILFPFAIVAVIFGYLALSEIRKSDGRLTGRAMAIWGIVLGYIGVACFAGLMGLGLYSLRRENQRRAAAAHPGKENKRSLVGTVNTDDPTVSSVRTLNMAEIAYSQAHRESGYTCSLSDLSGAWGIGTLAEGKKDGYVFKLQGCKAAKGAAPITKYQVLAYPADPTPPGIPAYCSDESDSIRVDHGGSWENCLKRGKDLPAAE